MKKFQKIIGYSKQLEEKNKIAYILTAIGLSQLLIFMVFYVTVVKSPLLIIETACIILFYLVVFFSIKEKVIYFW